MFFKVSSVIAELGDEAIPSKVYYVGIKIPEKYEQNCPTTVVEEIKDFKKTEGCDRPIPLNILASFCSETTSEVVTQVLYRDYKLGEDISIINDPAIDNGADVVIFYSKELCKDFKDYLTRVQQLNILEARKIIK